jgi:hypothetical protein
VKHLESDILCPLHDNGENVSYEEILQTMQRPQYKNVCKGCNKSFKTYDLKYRHEKFNCKVLKSQAQAHIQEDLGCKNSKTIKKEAFSSHSKAIEDSPLPINTKTVTYLYQELKRLQLKVDQLISNTPVTNN